MTLALLFPGQGSQSVGMGRALARTYEAAARIFEEADQVLGAELSRIAWEGPDEELVLTKNAQPAILVHSLAVHRVVRELLGPVAVAAGHSLGEFSAHVVAGTLSFRDALRAVRRRGELMFQSGRERPGTMAAVLGLGDEEVERVCREASGEDAVVVPANFNSDGQVVISGDVAAVRGVEDAMKRAGARRFVPLNVSGAFHSPLMKSAEDGLRDYLQDLEFRDPEVPVISNVTAAPVTQGEEARELLVRQLTAPVRWARSVAAMLESGVEAFLELGPGSVLCGLSRRSARNTPCRSVGEPEDVDGLAETESGG